MFCTNCGEEMRAIDKFCANCGAAAAPRPAKSRATDSFLLEPPASTRPEPPAPARAPQSTAEAFHAPLPAAPASAGNGRQPELGFSTSAWQAPPTPVAQQDRMNPPAPPVRAAAASPPPLSRQQEQQALLEAEEIASVRGMLPIDALPADFPPAAPAPTSRVANPQTCGACGEPNPAGNRFCERCGRPLETEPVAQPSAAPVRSATPSPITQTSWLDVPEPAPAAAAARVKAPAAAKAATTPGPPVTTANGKDKDFFYFYDDTSAQRSNRKLIIALMVVLALGVLGVIYLLSRPAAKSAVAANVTITISPTETEVPVGEAHDFSATVTGSGDTDVIWSVAEGSAGGNVVSRGAQAQGGAVANMGVYVAPTTPGTYHVVATSKANTTKSATAEVLVSGK